MNESKFTEITAAEALGAMKQGCALIDVRTPAEFDEAHVAGALNIPLGEMSLSDLCERYPSGALYFSCKSGARSRRAAQKLAEVGRGQVYCVSGGIGALASAGASIIRGRHTMSLERQVRIGAGSLALIGIILAVTIHPGYLLISAFVGAGLIFAGVTDRCGLALLLARMPWNRHGGATCGRASNRASETRVVHGG